MQMWQDMFEYGKIAVEYPSPPRYLLATHDVDAPLPRSPSLTPAPTPPPPACRCGPLSLVFMCGQQVWRLPHQLEHATHALLWPWDTCPGVTSGGGKAKSTGEVR